MAFDWLAIFCPEYPELDVDLNLAARSMDFAEPCSPPHAVQSIALEDTGYTGSRDLDVVIARQVPNDVDGSQVLDLAQVKNLLDDLRQCSVVGFIRDWFLRTRAASPYFSNADFQRQKLARPTPMYRQVRPTCLRILNRR